MIQVLASVYFCITFAGAWLAMFFYPRSVRTERGVAGIFLSYLTLVCWGVIPAGILSLIRIPVQLFSMGTVYLLTCLGLFGLICRRGKRQRYKWELYDILTAVFMLVIVLAIAFCYFTPELKLRYWTSDAAVHMTYALNTYRNGEVFNMYFAPLYNALVIGVLSPFLTDLTLYKGFMVADLSMFFLEGVMFLILARTFLKNRWMKALGFIAAVLYLLGYPLYCYTDTFLYWGIGVMLIGYLVYTVNGYIEERVEKKAAVFMMMVGCAGLILCYALFAPAAFFSLFLCLLIKAKREGNIFKRSNVLLALKIFALPCLLGVYYCYIKLLLENAGGISKAIATEGAIYREWYIDFFWLFPLALFLALYNIKRRKFNVRAVFLGVFLVYTVGMFLAAYSNRVSSYYYYKLYYPLWLLFWLLNVEALGLLWKKMREIVVSFAVIYASFALLCLGSVEDKIRANSPLLVTENRGNPFFALYLLNKQYLRTDWKQFEMPKGMFGLVEYVGEQGEEQIPFLTDIDQYAFCYWYEALTGQNSFDYYGWFHPLEEQEELWEKNGVDKVALWKKSSYYQENRKYFKQFDKVFENKECVVIDVNSE